MALNSGKILMRRGQEVNFDPNKMTPGEWAVSLDNKYVRMCFSPGVCVRMATYDAFEADMVQIRRILAECQTIEEAVARINDEISVKEAAVAEYTAQAKQYRDEAEQFRNQSFSSTPEGYLELVEQVGENTRKIAEGVGGVSSYTDLENKPKINDVVLEGEKTLEELGIASKDALEKTDSKVNIIIEQAELRFKETASGENIHLDDSADSKLVEFNMYGKAFQNKTTGKNLIVYPYKVKTNPFVTNGITFKDNGDGTITANGTATDKVTYVIHFRGEGSLIFNNGNYILSGCPSGGSVSKYSLRANRLVASSGVDYPNYDTGNGALLELNGDELSESEVDLGIFIHISNGTTVSNLTFKPMIRLASIEDPTYEPYTGGIPSPNPEYPQDIEVSGESGSVEVKSVGKNLLPYPYYETTKTHYDVTFTDNGDGSIRVNGTATGGTAIYYMRATISGNFGLIPDVEYKLSGCPSGGGSSSYKFDILNINGSGNATDFGSGASFIYDPKNNEVGQVRIVVYEGTTVNNMVFKPMIRLATDTDNTWEPYKGKTATIPTENGLAGIKVDNNGNYTDEDGQHWICDEIVKYADGSGAYIKRIAKRIFDGVNNASRYVGSVNNGTETVMQMNLDNTDSLFLNSRSAMCDKFKIISWTSATHSVPYSCRHASNGSVCCYLPQSDGVTDIATANAWLQENNVTVYYILKEPITTPLTAEELAEIEKLSTFYPVTNMSNDADCGMKVKYIADAKRYVDNRIALIEQAMLNSI